MASDLFERNKRIKILSLEQTKQVIQDLQTKHKRIVVAGGCFDILHRGHIEFLEQSKKQGDVLIVLLESDERIQQIKGNNRPINQQADRAFVLSHLTMVDYVILLPFFTDDTSYDELILSIKPAIITTTLGDTAQYHKKRQAELVGAQLIEVIDRIQNVSTSKVASLLAEEL